MAQLTKGELLERIADAIISCGWRAIIESDSHPFRITVMNSAERINLIVYVWNTTHGGGNARPADEYRIQLTGVNPPLVEEKGKITLLLGWAEDWYVFTAYDITRHRSFSKRSPSIQLRRSAIDKAISDGFSFHQRQNDEIVVAFRPEFLLTYIKEQTYLHNAPNNRLRKLTEAAETTATAQATIADNQISDEVLVERPAITKTVSQFLRDATFTKRVIQAYENTCAMCGMQFNILESAHIIPVSKAWNFSTRNGLALCPNHHKAYDRGIIGVRPNFEIVVQPQKVKELEMLSLIGGKEYLLGNLFKNIRIPKNPVETPAPNFLRSGLVHRGWSKELIEKL